MSALFIGKHKVRLQLFLHHHPRSCLLPKVWIFSYFETRPDSQVGLTTLCHTRIKFELDSDTAPVRHLNVFTLARIIKLYCLCCQLVAPYCSLIFRINWGVDLSSSPLDKVNKLGLTLPKQDFIHHAGPSICIKEKFTNYSSIPATFHVHLGIESPSRALDCSLREPLVL